VLVLVLVLVLAQQLLCDRTTELTAQIVDLRAHLHVRETAEAKPKKSAQTEKCGP
jgi:hypothetical protein